LDTVNAVLISAGYFRNGVSDQILLTGDTFEIAHFAISLVLLSGREDVAARLPNSRHPVTFRIIDLKSIHMVFVFIDSGLLEILCWSD
jgi:hypothetical protein